MTMQNLVAVACILVGGDKGLLALRRDDPQRTEGGDGFTDAIAVAGLVSGIKVDTGANLQIAQMRTASATLERS